MGDQDVTRPSEFVVPEKLAWASEGSISLRTTGMEVAGRPVTVLRTWQVIGGRVGCGCAIVYGVCKMGLCGSRPQSKVSCETGKRKWRVEVAMDFEAVSASRTTSVWQWKQGLVEPDGLIGSACLW